MQANSTNPTHPLRRIPLPLIILLVTVLLVVALFTLRPKPETAGSVNLQPLVNTMAAKPASHRPLVTLYGRVESPRESRLSTTVSAYVDQVLVKEGALVSEGQILVQLDDSDVRRTFEQRQAELEDMEAQIASERQRYRNDVAALKVEQELLALSQKAADRLEKLVQKKVGSDASRDDALQQAQRQELTLNNRQYAVQDHPNRLKRLQAQLKKITALRDQAATDLARTRIVAPFNGRITQMNASPGNRVRPGDVIVSLFDTGQVEVRAQIPSRYLAPVNAALNSSTGLNASLTLGGESNELRLERLAGAISMGQGGVDALFQVLGKDSTPILGRAGEVLLQMPAIDNSLAVPPTAIYGQNRLYLVEEGVLRTVEVKRLGEVLMESGERWQLVTGDVKAGDPILTTQLPDAVGGLAVKMEAPSNEQ